MPQNAQTPRHGLKLRIDTQKTTHFLPADLTNEQKLKFSRLHKKSSRLSRNSARCETLYRDIGMIFFSFPLQIREELIADEDVNQLFISTDDEKDPQIVSSLTRIRSLKDDMKDALRRRDVNDAEAKFLIADALIDDVKDELLSAKYHLENKDILYVETYPEGAFEDEGLPYHGFSIEGFGAKYEEIERWCQSLPEVKHAVELGTMTKEEAFHGILGIEEEERFIDDEDELEFEDMESIDSSPEDEESGERDGGEDGSWEQSERLLLGAWAFR